MLFLVVWIVLKKFVDLFGCLILGCFGCVEETRGSILMGSFGLLGLCCTNPWILSDALFWVVWVVLNKCVNVFGSIILGCFR